MAEKVDQAALEKVSGDFIKLFSSTIKFNEVKHSSGRFRLEYSLNSDGSLFKTISL